MGGRGEDVVGEQVRMWVGEEVRMWVGEEVRMWVGEEVRMWVGEVWVGGGEDVGGRR